MKAVNHERWVIRRSSPEHRTCMEGPLASPLSQSQGAWVPPAKDQSAVASTCSDLFGWSSQAIGHDLS